MLQQNILITSQVKYKSSRSLRYVVLSSKIVIMQIGIEGRIEGLGSLDDLAGWTWGI